MEKTILKLFEVKYATGMSRTSIYRGAANGTFPSPIKLSERSSGWLKSEIEVWLKNRTEDSRSGFNNFSGCIIKRSSASKNTKQPLK